MVKTTALGRKRLQGSQTTKTPRTKKRNLFKLRNLWKKKHIDKGVVYLSHIPHGFYEQQIKDYFTQFGKVTQVSMPRSVAGRSRGYAFIEFLHPEVAQIAAETMNNYLMFNRLMKAKYLPPEQQKPRLFYQDTLVKGTHTTRYDLAPLKEKQVREMRNQHLDSSAEHKLACKLMKRCENSKRQLQELGVEPEIQIGKGNLEKVLEGKKLAANKRAKKEDFKLKEPIQSPSKKLEIKISEGTQSELQTTTPESQTFPQNHKKNPKVGSKMMRNKKTKGGSVLDKPSHVLLRKKENLNKNSKLKNQVKVKLQNKVNKLKKKTVLDKEKKQSKKSLTTTKDSPMMNIDTLQKDSEKKFLKRIKSKQSKKDVESDDKEKIKKNILISKQEVKAKTQPKLTIAKTSKMNQPENLIKNTESDEKDKLLKTLLVNAKQELKTRESSKPTFTKKSKLTMNKSLRKGLKPDEKDKLLQTLLSNAKQELKTRESSKPTFTKKSKLTMSKSLRKGLKPDEKDKLLQTLLSNAKQELKVTDSSKSVVTKKPKNAKKDVAQSEKKETSLQTLVKKTKPKVKTENSSESVLAKEPSKNDLKVEKGFNTKTLREKQVTKSKKELNAVSPKNSSQNQIFKKKKAFDLTSVKKLKTKS